MQFSFSANQMCRPEVFKITSQESAKLGPLQPCTAQQDDETCSDYDRLPPLEANTNGQNPLLSHFDTAESESDPDADNPSYLAHVLL